MIDIQRSSLIWRFEAAGLEGNPSLVLLLYFLWEVLIYKNVKLLRISQEKIFSGRIQSWPGRYRGTLVLENSRKVMM